MHARSTALVPVIAALALLLAACGPGAPAPTPSLTPADPSAAPSIVPDPIETAVGADSGAIPADMSANIIDAMNSGNTAALEGYLAPTVHITYAASEYEGDVSDHVLIVNDLTDLTSPTATWDFGLPASVVEGYAAFGYPAYADDFPPGAFVGRSSDNKVVSFVIANGLITRILLALDESALS
jgi:hypothetical protein